MTDEPPESQQPWPQDRQQPYQRRNEPDDPVTQQLFQPFQPDHYGAGRPWTQPGYDQPPYQLMGPLFESGSNYGEFRSNESMTRWRMPNQRRRKILLAAAYAAALVVVAVVAGVLISSLAKPAASTGSAAAAAPPASSPPATVPPTTPASSPAASDVVGVLSWWVSYGMPAFQQVSTTMSQLRTDATTAETTHEFSAVEADLATAQSEIQAAQADPPIPDATLEQLWSTALADYGSGVSEMLDGVQNNLDLTEIKQGAAEVVDGNTPINTLIGDINNLAP